MINDPTCVLERDDRQKQTDPGRDCALHAIRDRIDDPFTHGQDTQYNKDNTRQKYSAQADLPRMSHAKHDTKCKVSVQPHTRRNGNWIVRNDTHNNRANGSRQTRGDKYRAMVHAGLGKDAWVHKHYIGKCQERRHTSNDLGAHRRAVLSQLKILIEHNSPLKNIFDSLPWRYR